MAIQISRHFMSKDYPHEQIEFIWHKDLVDPLSVHYSNMIGALRQQKSSPFWLLKSSFGLTKESIKSPKFWLSVKGTQQSPVDSPHKEPVMLKHFWVISDLLTSSCISKILLQPTCFSCERFPSDEHQMAISNCPCWRSQLLKAGTIKHAVMNSPTTLMMTPQQGDKNIIQ